MRVCSRITALVAFSWCSLVAQQNAGYVQLTAVFNPAYPTMAVWANITGDVELSLAIRKDGSIASLVVVSGVPMLSQAALASARQSRFECRQCKSELTPYSLFYSFQLVAGPDFPCSESHLHVTQYQNHISVIGEPHVVDSNPASVKVRSPKCLYLWSCGSHWGGEDYYFYRIRSAKCLDLWNCGHRLREPFARCKKLGRPFW